MGRWWYLWFLSQTHEATTTVTSDQILYQQRVRMLSHADEIGNLAETCPVSMRVTGADGTSIAERTGVPVNGLLEWSDIAIPNPGAYRVEVTIVRPAVPISPFVASWNVDGAPVARAKTMLSTRSWAPLAAALAAMWLVIVAIGRWWTLSALRADCAGLASFTFGGDPR